MQPGRRLTDLEPAGFARRSTAFVVDIVVVFLAVVVLLQFVLDPLREALGPAWVRVGWFYIAYTLLTVSLPTWLYFAGYESGEEGATLGKRWLGLRVRSVVGGRPSFPRALLRTIVKLLPIEIAHFVIAVPANPFVDPITGSLTLPALGSLGPTVLAGLLVALLLAGATLLAGALNHDRRAMHDFLAGTWVVKARDPAAAAPVRVGQAAQGSASLGGGGGIPA